MEEELFEALYQHTKGECGNCRIPHSCCDNLFCQGAKDYAASKGVTLEPTGHPTLMFMGPQGCVVPPHLRPLCTAHVCSIGNFGYKPGDEAWTEEYYRLRDLVNEAMLANIRYILEVDISEIDSAFAGSLSSDVETGEP